MILYFSGTGNSEYAAKRIGRELNDQVVNLFERIRGRDFTEIHSGSPWVVAVPTYAWRIPRIVREWLENTNLTGNRDIYFVLTCGESIGNAGVYLEKLCAAKNLHYLGCAAIPMPENYIAMFSVPPPDKALEIIEKAEGIIDKTAHMIMQNVPFPKLAVSAEDMIKSGVVNQVFYPLFVHAKKFHASDACISCGKCAGICPLNNIYLENRKPVWGKRCTHCMSCINRCPRGAIEYGEHSKVMARYICPKSIGE